MRQQQLELQRDPRPVSGISAAAADKASPWYWFVRALQGFSDFDARARGKEYWYFQLINYALAFIACMACALFFSEGVANGVYAAWMLVTLLPSLAVSCRRLHDTGRSAWWLWLWVIPLAGSLILLFWLAGESEPGANAYGPNPKTDPHPHGWYRPKSASDDDWSTPSSGW